MGWIYVTNNGKIYFTDDCKKLNNSEIYSIYVIDSLLPNEKLKTIWNKNFYKINSMKFKPEEIDKSINTIIPLSTTLKLTKH